MAALPAQVGYKFTRRSLFEAAGAAAFAVPFTPIRGITIGVCGPLRDYADAKRYGFDYFEPGVAEIAGLSDKEFEVFREQVPTARLPCTTCNSFIRSLRVVGPNVDKAALADYLTKSLDRCRQLGTRVVVWGSAGSRNVPEGFSRDEAWKQIKTFLRQAVTCPKFLYHC